MTPAKPSVPVSGSHMMSTERESVGFCHRRVSESQLCVCVCVCVCIYLYENMHELHINQSVCFILHVPTALMCVICVFIHLCFLLISGCVRVCVHECVCVCVCVFLCISVSGPSLGRQTDRRTDWPTLPRHLTRHSVRARSCTAGHLISSDTLRTHTHTHTHTKRRTCQHT